MIYIVKGKEALKIDYNPMYQFYSRRSMIIKIFLDNNLPLSFNLVHVP